MSAELDAKWLELHKAGKVSWVEPMRERLEGCRFAKYREGDRTQAMWITEETRYASVRAVLDLLTAKDVPDWSDPATVGCLLGQVRERRGNPLLYIEPNGHEGWGLASPGGMVMHQYRVICAGTEAGVCLRALEAAP